MRQHEQAIMLIALAKNDLKTALLLLNEKEIISEAIGFHLHQSVEKALKAWLDFFCVIYPKTHDLSLLLLELEKKGEHVDMFWPLIELNSFSVQFQYEIYFEDNFLDWLSTYGLSEILISQVEGFLQNH